MSLINDALKRANAEHPREAGSTSTPPTVPAMQPVEPAPPSPILPWAVVLLGIAVLAVAAVLFFRPGPQVQLAQNSTAAPTEATPAPGGASYTSPIPTPTPPPASTPAIVSTDIDHEPVVTPAAAEPKSPSQPESTTLTVAALPSGSTAAPNAQPSSASSPPIAATIPTEVPPSTTAATPEPPSAETKIAANTPAPTETPTLSKAPAPAAESRPPRLQAIYYRLREPSVVINGKTLRTGQSTQGIKVVSIQRTSVEVMQDGKYRTLTLQD